MIIKLNDILFINTEDISYICKSDDGSYIVYKGGEKCWVKKTPSEIYELIAIHGK